MVRLQLETANLSEYSADGSILPDKSNTSSKKESAGDLKSNDLSVFQHN